MEALKFILNVMAYLIIGLLKIAGGMLVVFASIIAIYVCIALLVQSIIYP